jgi:predicted Zn-dependent protease with MMP-like domain
MKRMSLDRFGRIVAGVIDELPEEVKQLLDNVAVDVEEEPDDETLRDAGFTEEEIAAGEAPYGLFESAPPEGATEEALHVRNMPHRICVYKRPLEEDFPDRRELMTQIRKTVIHEVAHHFGYSDRDLERWTSVY